MNTTYNLKWAVLALLAYAVMLLLTFPAERAYNTLQQGEPSGQAAIPGLILSRFHGSAWCGSAEQGTIHGQQVAAVSWQVRPWTLLFGGVGLSWQLNTPATAAGSGQESGIVRGESLWNLDGSLEIPALEARLPVNQLAEALGMASLRPVGVMAIDLDHLSLLGTELKSINGTIVWQQAGIELMKPLQLGDLRLSLETRTDGILGIISDGGGPLALEGTLQLQPDGRYQFKATAQARGNDDNARQLSAYLNSLGPRGPDGKIRITRTGRLER